MATVERIKWTSNRIIAISRSSNTTFDTHKLYLKSDPNGILKIGGYQSTPSIWGQGDNIYNHDDMWYVSDIVKPVSYGYNPYGSNAGIWDSTSESEYGKFSVPRASLAKIAYSDPDSFNWGFQYFSPMEDPSLWCYGPLQYVQLNGKDTSVQFRWIAKIRSGVTFVNSAQNSMRLARVAPYLYNATYLPSNKNSSGYYRFPAPPGYIDTTGNGWRARSAMGELLVSPDGTQLKNRVYASIQFDAPPINYLPFCVMTQLQPVTLSVGVTP